MAARILFLLLLLPIFVVQSALAHDYGDALGKTLLFLEAQRSGRLPPNQKRVNWRGDSALKDGLAQGVDLVGGYYDAGDNVKFGLPMAFTVTMLSWSIIEYANQLSAAGQLGFAMDAVRWGTDYLVKAHSASDVLWGEVGDGDSDHACWERPEDMTTSRTAFRVDSSSPGSDLAAETAAAMAAASIVFASHGTASYSGLLLAHARQLFAFADKYRGKYDDSIGVAHKYYQSTSGYHDELLWGALWLYQATGEDSFLRYAADNANSLGGVTWRAKEFSWDVKYAGVQVLAAKILLSNGGGSCASTLKQYKAMADYFMCATLRKNQGDNAMATPAGLLYVRPWNNMQYVAASAFLAAVYADYLGPKGLPVDCPAGNVSPADLGRWAQSQVDYILGNNPRRMSYLVGYGPVFPHMVHHRGSSMPSQKSKPVPVGCLQGYADWYNRNLPNPNVLTGALVGGPDKNDNFKDQRNNYEQTEATTYNVAPLLGLLAKFYGLANPKPDAVPLTQKEPPRPAAAPSRQEIALAQAITGWWKSNGHIHYRHRVTVTNNSNRVLRQINVWISNLQGSVWGLLPGTSEGLYVLPPWIKSVKPGQRVHFGYVQAGPQASISVGEYY